MTHKTHRLAPAVLVGAALIVCATARASLPACGYEITAVIEGPQCPDALATVYPYALNDKGQVVGNFFCPGGMSDWAFLWDEGEFIVLEPPDADADECRDINNASQIAGTGNGPSGDEQGFFLDSDGFEFIEIPEGGNFTRARAIGEDGMIVGFWGNWKTGDPSREAFTWRDGVITPLGELLAQPQSIAYDVNVNGQITGYAGDSYFTDARAFI